MRIKTNICILCGEPCNGRVCRTCYMKGHKKNEFKYYKNIKTGEVHKV